jgi:flagellar basal-body rod protein FlgG
MYSALWVAKTGLDAQQTQLAVISNNLANVNTTGYKRSRAVFQDLLYQNVRQGGAQSSQDTILPSGFQIGTGVETVATEKLFTQGNMIQTNNALDVAIDGRGFLQVLMPDGSMGFSRDGSIKLDDQGRLVNAEGYVLDPAITIPANAQSITISVDGVVSVLTPGTSAPVQVGNFQLADFVNPAGLQAVGKNLYIETSASGSPQIGTPGQNGIGSLSQGSLETSNVNVVEELINMIEAQRAYEMNSKAISTADQMLAYVNNNM